MSRQELSDAVRVVFPIAGTLANAALVLDSLPLTLQKLNDGDAGGRQLVDHVEEVLHLLRVEHGGGLVHDDQFRVVDEAPRSGGARRRRRDRFGHLDLASTRLAVDRANGHI